MAKVSLTDITGGYQSVAVYNANNQLIEDEFDNCLSRDGTAPNSMAANIDMNSNKVTNLADGTNQQDAVTVAQLNAASVVVSTAAASAVTVADAGGLLAADTVEGALAEIAAEVDTNTADIATNTSAISGLTAANHISNVVEDTSPQLGAALDTNNFNIEFKGAGPSKGVWYGSGGTKTFSIYHDDTDANFDLAPSGDINFLNGKRVQFWNAANSLYAGIQYGGTKPYLVHDDDFYDFPMEQLKVKTADQSVTSSTTLVDDTHMTGFEFVSGSYYAIEAYLHYTQSVGDLKFTFTYTASPSVRMYTAWGVAEDGTTDADTDNAGSEIIIDGLTDGQDCSVLIRGHIKVASSGSGKLQWAQNTSSATPTTLKEGSWCRVSRLRL